MLLAKNTLQSFTLVLGEKKYTVIVFLFKSTNSCKVCIIFHNNFQLSTASARLKRREICLFKLNSGVEMDAKRQCESLRVNDVS